MACAITNYTSSIKLNKRSKPFGRRDCSSCFYQTNPACHKNENGSNPEVTFDGPSLNLNYLEIQYGGQIRRNSFLEFVALYLFVALHPTPAQSVYTSVFLSPIKQNSQ